MLFRSALQDNNRALLVGQKTFGKGLVQSVRGLSDGSGMTVTIAKYLTPANHDIHHRGIVPNVPAKLTEEEAKSLTIEDLGTRKDPQYRVAETTLIHGIQTSAGLQRAFVPGSANVPAAVGAH